MLLNYRGNCAVVLGVHLVGRVKVFPVVGGPWKQELLLIEKCVCIQCVMNFEILFSPQCFHV